MATRIGERENTSWQQHLGDRLPWRLTPGRIGSAQVVRPQSLKELRLGVREAARSGAWVKAAGARFSLSRAYAASVQIDTSQLRRILPTERHLLRDPHALVIACEAGSSICNLDQRLSRLGLSVSVTGALTRVSIAGAAATSTHGSGLRQLPWCDRVRSITLVRSDGSVVRLEPRDGPTDPRAWPRSREDLVQDDDLFYASVAGVGCAGVVYSMLLDVVPRRVSRSVSTVTTWEIARDELASLEPSRAPEGHALLLTPYARRGADRTVVRSTTRPVEPHEIGADPPVRSPMSLACSYLPVSWLAARTAMLCPRAVPWLVETATRTVLQPDLQGSTRELCDGEPMNTAASVVAMELSVDLVRAREALESVLDVAESEARRGRPLIGPLSVRFVGPSSHYLSPAYGRPTCVVEVITLRNATTTVQALEPYARALMPLGARPHLGLHLPETGMAYGTTFPRLAEWQRAIRTLDPLGTFRGGGLSRRHLFA